MTVECGLAVSQKSMRGGFILNCTCMVLCSHSAICFFSYIDADLPCRSKNAANCIGREFGLSNSNERWFNPENPHGTHVAGTIGALGNNDEGVVGMIPDGDVCYIIARVFGDKSEGARFSDILSAVLWTVKKGAKVINMSLGGTEQDSSAEKVFQSIYNDDGRLVVASSGNSGTTDDRYPASYDTVISVAAVDQNYNKAEFSQYNKNVDIAAPGVDILSTLPANKGYILNIFVEDGRVFSGQKMQYSPDIGNTISGNLALCGSYGQNGCDANGKICLIER